MLTVNFIMAANSPSTVQARSGASYTADANGVMKNVSTSDVLDMLQAGGIPLGQSQVRSNLSATTSPTNLNDGTQDYGVGSRWINTVTGIEYVCLNSSTGAAVWDATNGEYENWVAGRFYGIPEAATLGTMVLVTGTLYAYPLTIPSEVTLQSLNVGVTTGQAGGSIHAGLYADNGAGYPGALVQDSGALSGTATAVVAQTGIAKNLASGLYWVALLATATGTMPTVDAMTSVSTNIISNEEGYDTAAHALAGSAEFATGISVAQAFGALPATFPVGATESFNASTPVVAIGV